MQPQVTAIVTCMTDAERPYVKAALSSALSQTLPCAVRLYVRDGNSWIDEIVAAWPGIEVRKVPTMNSASVRNLGVAEAATKYVAFLDSDDIWFPDKTARQVSLAEHLGAAFVGADHVLINERGERFAFGAARFLPMPSSWLVRRDYMRDFPFNEALFRREDKEWWFHRASPMERHRLPEFLIGYRVRADSKSAQPPRTNRKVWLSRLSEVPGMGWPLLAGSWLHHRINRKHFYSHLPKVRGPHDGGTIEAATSSR